MITALEFKRLCFVQIYTLEHDHSVLFVGYGHFLSALDQAQHVLVTTVLVESSEIPQLRLRG